MTKFQRLVLMALWSLLWINREQFGRTKTPTSYQTLQNELEAAWSENPTCASY